MRWSPWVRTRPPPATRWLARAVPATIRPSGSSSTPTPQAARPAAIRAMRSLSLTRSSPMPRMTVAPFGVGGGHGQDRIFVDHRGRARRPARRRPCRRRMARGDVADRLAALLALRSRSPGPRPSRAGSRTGRCAAGLSSTPSTVTAEPGRDQRRDERKGRRRRIARHADRRAGQRLAAGQADAPAVAASSDLHLGAEGPQHPLGMVAGRLPARSPRSRPAAFSPASSTADFTCAEGSGRR